MNKVFTFQSVAILAIIFVGLLSYLEFSYVVVFKEISTGLIITGLALALFFGRSKVFTLLLIPLFFSFYMFYPTHMGLDGGNYSFWYLFPITTSLGFLFIGILQERGLYCFYGVSKVIVMFFILGFTHYLLATFSYDFKTTLDTSIISCEIPVLVNDFTFLIALLATLFAAVVSLAFFKNNIEKASFWALISLLIPPIFFQTPSSFILFSSLSSVIFIVALLKDNYSMAYIDTLTGIPARRALEEEFLKLESTFALAIVDIDFFKKFKDTYGHDVGDEVLKLVAEQLSAIKGGGRVFRYGGEEFAIVFANKTHSEILTYLEDVRIAIEKRAFVLRGKDRPKNVPEKIKKSKNSKSVYVTVSIGVANAPADGKKPKKIMKKADIALYKAKKSGRNCTKTS